MRVISHPDYSIRSVPLTRPFIWLACGWDDLLHHRMSSLLYGVIVCALGILIVAYERHPFYLAAAISGFLLVGPILAAGLCELSRCSDRNLPTDFNSSLKALRRNHDSLLGVANRLLFISISWFVFSFLLMQAWMTAVAPDIHQTVGGDVLRHLSEQQLFSYLICGGILAVIVFALSVVTIPMIVDRHVDARTAIRTSIRVAIKDMPVMLVWSALIVVLVLIGFATWMIGIVVIFPLLGHATWYAYRDLVRQ